MLWRNANSQRFKVFLFFGPRICFVRRVFSRHWPSLAVSFPTSFPGSFIRGKKDSDQAGHVPPKNWEVTKKQREGDVTKSWFCLSLTHYGTGNFVYKSSVVSQHQLRGEMSKTPKKIYVASSNATSSSRLYKFMGDFSHCKNLFRKANHALLLAAEEIYGSYFCIYAVDLAKGVLKTS